MTQIKYNLKEIQALTGGELIGAPVAEGEESHDLSFDSRKIHAGERSIFVALRGKHRDGHSFIPAAHSKGARAFILEDAAALPDGASGLLVQNCLDTLQALAHAHREQFSYPVVGITGSNGKTIVKEWLAEVLGGMLDVVRSPGSYNSQLGVALSLLEMPEKADLGLVEAGISEKGEMEKLSRMVAPDLGILTHFGDAHAEGFESKEEKLVEKLKLFVGCKLTLVSGDDGFVVGAMEKGGVNYRCIGGTLRADVRVLGVEANGDGSRTLYLEDNGDRAQLRWGIEGEAALENVLLVILVARYFGMPWTTIQAGLDRLHPVSMRTEMLTDNPEITIINDTYNADQASVLNAFSLLEQSSFHSGRAVVLSDLQQLGAGQEVVQTKLLEAAVKRFGSENVVLVGPVFHALADALFDVPAYKDVDAFLADFDYARFQDKTVLLKGARRFQLERIIPYLGRKATATYFKVDLDHLRHNYRSFRSRVADDVKVMAMVKALAYGSGDWEVAQALEEERVDYLAVAYTSEGIALRTKGIQVPIMVMNADPNALDQLFRFKLEPEVHSLGFLRAYAAAGRRVEAETFPVHLKVETGMLRLGFQESDLEALNGFLMGHPELQVKSVLTHLARADEAEGDDFSRAQVERFVAFADGLETADQAEKPMRHVLNSAGILRFPEYHFDMVRLGIGLYGIAPYDGADLPLKEVGSLHSVVTQVHEVPLGTPVGYGGSSVTEKPSKVATVAIGYADGIRRSLSNGAMSFLVRGQRAPTIGRVCMDMMMLDVTEIDRITAGDEVVLLGAQGSDFISVNDIAKAADTIAYEVLVNIGQRVRRVYERE